MRRFKTITALFIVVLLFLSFAIPTKAAVYYSNNFDSDTTGTTPTGWVNLGSATWKVGTSSPVSGSKNLEDPVQNLGSIAVYTGASAVADSAGQISQKVKLDGSGFGMNAGLFLRVSSDGQNGYLFSPDFSNNGGPNALQMILFSKSAGSYNVVNKTSMGRVWSNGDTALIKAEVTGTTLRWKAWKSTESEPGSWTYSTTDGTVSAAGYVGLYEGYNNGSTGSTVSSIDDFYWGTVGSTFGGVLTAGSISLVSKNSSSVSLSSTAATGGTPSYTYQWYRSTSSGFTPGAGNILSGQTSLTLNDTGLSASTTYYYKIRATDSASATVDATEFSVTTNAIATSFTFTGPSSGAINTASSNFTVTPNGEYTGTITPATTGSGTFSPTSLTWSASSSAQTFTYTPTSTAGSPHTISVSSSPTITNSSGTVSYTVSSYYYSNNFDSDTVSSLPTGWTNIGSATWAVGTTSPVSVTKDLEDPTFHISGMAVYTGASAVADSAAQISQVVKLDGSLNGNNTGLFIRVSADGQNGYLFAPGFNSNILRIFKKVSGSYTEIDPGGSGVALGRTFANNEIALLKAEASGTTLRFKVWKSTESEPGSWTVSMTDSSVSAAGYIGVYEGFNAAQGSNVSAFDDVYWGAVGSNFSNTPATSFTFTGPSSGVVNSISSNFTITPNGLYTGTITPATTGSGTFSPTSLTWSASSSAQTFTYTPTSTAGSPHTISVSSSPTITNSSGTVAYTVSAGSNVIPVNNSAWVAGLSPYNWYVSGSSYIQAINPGAYFKVKFSGTSISLGVDVSAMSGVLAKKYPRITYKIDNGSWQTYQLLSSSSEISLASSLTDTVHDIKVVLLSSDAYTSRWNGTMSLKINYITLDLGKTVSATTLLPKKLIAYGDSITEGAWVLGDHSDLSNYSLYEESESSYVKGVADDLNAELGNFAFGGQSWETTFNGDVPALPSAWNYIFNTNSRLTGGLFSPAPDYVLVNMGTNGGVSAASVVSNWLTSLRTAIGSNARIFVLIPFNQTASSTITSGFNSYKTGANDSKAFLIDLGSNGVTYADSTPTYSYDGLHPNVTGQSNLRTLVTAAMQANIPSSVSTVTSATYTVSALSSGAGTITNVPFGTSKTVFEATLTKGESHSVWDDSGIHSTVVSGDVLVVTAQDGTTTGTYTITVNPDPTVVVSTPSSGGGGGGGHMSPSLYNNVNSSVVKNTQDIKTQTSTEVPVKYKYIPLPKFNKNKQFHDTGADIKELQKFLNKNGFVVRTKGAGSPGKEDGVFSIYAYKALVNFQKSIGLPATGFLGPMTRVYLNKLSSK